MNYSAGVLTPRSTTLEWVKRCSWPCLPDKIKHDLDVALMTPGFTHRWWARVTGKHRNTVQLYRAGLSPDLIPEAIENYNSITRDDAIALAQFPGVKPIRSKVQLVEDIRNGMSWAEAQRTYKCTEMPVANILRYPLLSNPTMPAWFRALIPGA